MITSRSFLSFFLVLLFFSLNADADTEVKIGLLAPPLTLREVLQTPKGIHGTWEELTGKAVVVEFWAGVRYDAAGDFVGSVPIP